MPEENLTLANQAVQAEQTSVQNRERISGLRQTVRDVVFNLFPQYLPTTDKASPEKQREQVHKGLTVARNFLATIGQESLMDSGKVPKKEDNSVETDALELYLGMVANTYFREAIGDIGKEKIADTEIKAVAWHFYAKEMIRAREKMLGIGLSDEDRESLLPAFENRAGQAISLLTDKGLINISRTELGEPILSTGNGGRGSKVVESLKIVLPQAITKIFREIVLPKTITKIFEKN